MPDNHFKLQPYIILYSKTKFSLKHKCEKQKYKIILTCKNKFQLLC